MARSFVLLCIFTFTASRLLAQSGEVEELQFLIIEALTKNPDIAAQLHNMEAAEQRIPQAGALDDPRLNFKLMEIPGTQFNQATYANIELMQMVRFPTKLSTQKHIAAIQAEHAHHDHLEKVLEVIYSLKSAYAMLWNARTTLEINLENQRLVQQIINSAQTRYAVGGALQQDVLKTTIELAKLRTKEATLRQEVTSAGSMLRAILNRPTGALIGPIKLEALVPVPYTLDELLSYALTYRPMLLHDSLSVEESRLMLGLSRQEYIPDFNISLEYVTSPALNHKRWSVMAGISLPFAPWTLSKASARVQETEAARRRSESLYLASKNMIEARIRESYARVRAFEAEVISYERAILPQTYQSLQTVLVEYQTGMSQYLMLLDSFRMYQEVKMDAAMARMKYEQAVAQLEREVGVIDLAVVPGEAQNKQ